MKWAQWDKTQSTLTLHDWGVKAGMAQSICGRTCDQVSQYEKTFTRSMIQQLHKEDATDRNEWRKLINDIE